jgi:hypothetical protein
MSNSIFFLCFTQEFPCMLARDTWSTPFHLLEAPGAGWISGWSLEARFRHDAPCGLKFWIARQANWQGA